MSEAIKPTPGPCSADGQSVHSDAVRFIADCSDAHCIWGWGGSDFATEAHKDANAKLFADALNVFHETQCTPRQLVERVKELEDTLCSLAGRFLRCAAAGISAAEAYDSFYRDDVTEVLSKALPNAAAKEAGK